MSDQQTTFNNLPEEIVLMVFEYLNILDMKKARQVSKQWNYLLSYSKFTKNEILKLEKCLIAEHCEPMKSLMQSTKVFHQVEFGDAIKWDNEHVKTQLLNFLSQNCTILIIKRFNIWFRPLSEILDFFPNIEKLIAPDVELSDLRDAFKKFPRHNLKEIDISCESQLHGDELKVFGNVLLTKKSSLIRIPGLLSDQTKMLITETQTMSDHIQFQKVERCAQDLNPQGVIKGSIIVHPKDKTGCFFVHEVLSLPSVTDVEVEPCDNPNFANLCEKCVATLVKSCPNTQSWDFSVVNIAEVGRQELSSMKQFKISSPYVPMMFSQQTPLTPEPFQQLEVLELIDSDYSIGCETWLNWPQMPRLKELRINSCEAPIEKIVKASPGLRILVLPEFYAKFEDLKLIIEGLPYLQKLSVAMAYAEYNRENMLKLLSKSLNLKTLKLIHFELMDYKRFVWEMFPLIPTLHETYDTELEPITRADYEHRKSRIQFLK